MGMDEVPVTFTVDELWLLHYVIRHECPRMEDWESPPASPSLNKQLRLAILACETDQLREYTLQLSRRDLDVIDYNVKMDMQTPAASGRNILLKVFRATFELETGLRLADVKDKSYREVKRDA